MVVPIAGSGAGRVVVAVGPATHLVVLTVVRHADPEGVRQVGLARPGVARRSQIRRPLQFVSPYVLALARAIDAARWAAAQIDPTESHLLRHEWTWVWLGIAECRAGGHGGSIVRKFHPH